MPWASFFMPALWCFVQASVLNPVSPRGLIYSNNRTKEDCTPIGAYVSVLPLHVAIFLLGC